MSEIDEQYLDGSSIAQLNFVDILDDFNAPLPPLSTSSENKVTDITTNEEFLLSLTKGMEELLLDPSFDKSQINELQAGMSQFIKELATEQSSMAPNHTASTDMHSTMTNELNNENSFQTKVTNTLNKLKDSTEKADVKIFLIKNQFTRQMYWQMIYQKILE
jgi:hypothetical protein